MARRPRDSVAPLRRSSAGWMPARIGRLSAGVGRRHPVTIRIAPLMVGSIRQLWAMRRQTGVQYSAVEWIRARVAVRNVISPASQPQPASRLSSATRDASFLRSDKVSAVRERPVQRYSEVFGLGAERQCFVVEVDFSSHLASLLRWKATDTVFVVLSFSFQVWRYSHTVACLGSAPLPLPASLHQYAWLLDRQHMHTFWRWCLVGQKCRCWRVMPGRIPVGRHSWGVVCGLQPWKIDTCKL